jgi:hypothetical protein
MVNGMPPKEEGRGWGGIFVESRYDMVILSNCIKELPVRE